MVHIAADLPQFLQRRELAAYEQRLARTAYAYGVDLRRAAWLASSMVADPLMRSVDRRWSRTVKGLEEDSLQPLRKAPPFSLLEELAQLIQLLRAPLPTVRLLRPEVAAQWPMITPLGTTKGAIHWLVLDLDRVMALATPERTFALASALGHLQCDHGSIFAAHLMTHRGNRLGLIKGLLRPWAKVAVFSADRAGLVAVQSLQVASRVIERHDAQQVPWMPQWPSVDVRRLALEEFDHSTLMVRRRLLSDPDGRGWTMAPAGREDDVGSLSRRIRSVLQLARRRKAAVEDPAEDPEEEEGGDEEPEAPPEPPPDPERTARLEQALRDAWKLARCDERLTRRLKLL